MGLGAPSTGALKYLRDFSLSNTSVLPVGLDVADAREDVGEDMGWGMREFDCWHTAGSEVFLTNTTSVRQSCNNKISAATSKTLSSSLECAEPGLNSLRIA